MVIKAIYKLPRVTGGVSIGKINNDYGLMFIIVRFKISKIVTK